MVRTVTDNYSFWLTGYYDDFNNARAVADDLNVPSATVNYSSLKSHHGNPLNGEALLNPRYRWSIIDRENFSTTLDAISGVTMAEYAKLKNLGMYEWLSHDTIRNSDDNWLGRAQLQYPNGFAPNRFMFGDGTHNTNYKETGITTGRGYQLIANGYDTTGTYVLNAGDEDASFRRTAMEPYHTKTDGSTDNITSTEYVNKLAGKFNSWYTTSEPARRIQSAHLTGVWTGESLSYATGSATNVTPENLFHTIKSPGGKPFLVLKNIAEANGSEPSLIYDGALNTRLDNDVFHARIAARSHHGDTAQSNTIGGSSFTNGEYPMEVDFQVGFPTTSAGVTDTTGLVGTPAIQFKLVLGTTSGTGGLSGNYVHYPSYDCLGASYIGASAQTYSNDDAWIDVDIRIDFTNQKFYPYVDGTRVGTAAGYSLNGTSFGGSVSANEIYGYEIYHDEYDNGSTSTTIGVNYLMLDRVGVVRYLTSPLSNKDRHAETPISNLQLTMPNDGFSIINLEIMDDRTDDTDGSASTHYTYNLKQLFSNTDPVDCGLLIFASNEETRIDRPIWRGTIDHMDINQAVSSRVIKLQATHNGMALTKQIPMWDVGQLQDNNDEDGSVQYWKAENEGLKSIMHMGTRPLKMLDYRLGFGKHNQFRENKNQRLQLGSGHPIQMYNNSDPGSGPNSVEEQYTGSGINGIAQGVYNSSGELKLTVNSGGSVKTALYLPGTTDLTDSDNITIKNTSNHNATAHGIYDVHDAVVSTHVTEFTDVKTVVGLDSLTYTPESSKIIYMGRFIPLNTSYLFSVWSSLFGPSQAEEQWQNFLESHPNANMSTSDYMVVLFDSNPNLGVGQTFTINNVNIDQDKTSTTYGASTNASPINQSMMGIQRVTATGTVKDIYTTSRVGTTYASTPSIYYVITETPNHPSGWLEEKYGKITTVGTTLSANKRFNWTKETGQYNDSDTDGANAALRPLHARWMRDLPQSLWFKYHFGIIDYDPLAIDRANSTDNFTGGYRHVGTANTSGRQGNVLGSQLNDAGTAHSSANDFIEKGASAIRIAPVLYNALVAEQAWSGVAEIRAEGFWTTGPDIGGDSGTQPNKRGRFIWQDLQTISGGGSTHYLMLGCKFIDARFSTTISGTKSRLGTNQTYRNNVYILPLKFSDNYNHLWTLWADMRIDGKADADGGTRKTKFGLIAPTPDNYKVNLHFANKETVDAEADVFTELKINDDVTLWDVSAIDSLTGAGFSKPVNYGNGTASTALESVVLSANSGNIGSHGVAKLLVTKNSHGITSDYVHLFNTISHDGVHKVLDNATNTLVLDTKYLGTDTGYIGGTRLCPVNEATDTTHRDWEDKGGAMCIVDSSPFFNLNTGANQGGVYQVSGGTTDLEDYTVETTGFPALIDNYWAEVIASDNNKYDRQEVHPNAYKVVSDVTALADNIVPWQTWMVVDDFNIFANSGTGRFIVEDEVSGSNETRPHYHYFKWSCKNMTERTGTATMTSVVSTGPDYYGHYGYQLDLNGTDWWALGIRPGMGIYNETKEQWHTIVGVGEGAADKLDIDRGKTSSGDDALYAWADSDDWKIPVQIGGVWSMHQELEEGTQNDPDSIMNQINTAFEYDGRWGLRRGFTIKTTPDQTADDYDYEIVTVSTTIYTASQNITRLMMHLDGVVESSNSGTYYDSDKLRMLWNASLTKNWNPPTRLTSFFDINNVPITTSMTSDGGTTNNDNYGGVIQGAVKPLIQSLRDIQRGAGFGVTNNHHTSFSWLSGRDGRIDFRPKFNSGILFDRNSMLINNLKTTVAGSVTNVRVYYNGNRDFVDYPSANTSSTTNWKTLELPKVTNEKEAERLAKREYNASRKTNAVLTIEPNVQSYTEDGTTNTVSNHLLSTGRYGYIADPYIALQGKADTSVKPTSWTRLGTGGSLFTGMSNAFDGNLGTNGTLLNRWGKAGGQTNTDTGNITWANNFYWYGAASVSHAVQVVHIPNHCPLVSEETGEELRIFITPAENQATADYSIDNTTFNIWLMDYEYSNDRIKVANISGTGGTHSLNNTSRYSRTIVKENGFYELTIPRSYWNNSGAAFSPTRKIVVSFNADYCRDLLRHRCGDPASANLYKSANTLPGITAGTSSGNITTGNSDSIFPLGGRMYDEWYMFHGSGSRGIWNAPRIHMVRDLSYVPASYVKVTDAGLGYNNETFVIKSLDWNISAGKHDTLSLTLSLDESMRASNLTSFLPGNTVHTPTWSIPNLPVIPPSATPGIENSETPSQSGYTGSNRWLSKWLSGINSMSSGFHSTSRGRMSDTSNSIGSGETRVLGAPRASATPQTTTTHQPTTNVNVSGGNAVSSSSGFTFPGVGNVEDTNNPYFSSAFNQTLTIPNNVTSDTLHVVANLTHLAASGQAVITTKITKDSTEYSQTTIIPPATANQQITLFNGRVSGANVANTTIDLEFSRVAGSGNDNSSYNSVTMNNVGLKQSQTSVTTSSSTSQLPV